MADFYSRSGFSPDFLLAVSMGQIQGASIYHMRGKNPLQGAAAGYVTVSDLITAWVRPTQSRVHAIVSNAIQDDPASTGLWTVKVEGVSGGSLTSETVTLDGTTPVNTANSYTMIHRMRALTFGSGGAAVGNITATAATDGTITCKMVTPNNRSQLAAFQIPSDRTGYLLGGFLATGNNSDASVDVRLMAEERTEDNCIEYIEEYSVRDTSNTTATIPIHAPMKFLPGSFVELQASTDAASTIVTVGMDILLMSQGSAV